VAPKRAAPSTKTQLCVPTTLTYCSTSVKYAVSVLLAHDERHWAIGSRRFETRLWSHYQRQNRPGTFRPLKVSPLQRDAISQKGNLRYAAAKAYKLEHGTNRVQVCEGKSAVPNSSYGFHRLNPPLPAPASLLYILQSGGGGGHFNSRFHWICTLCDLYSAEVEAGIPNEARARAHTHTHTHTAGIPGGLTPQVCTFLTAPPE
jgi:hypothetical protein